MVIRWEPLIVLINDGLQKLVEQHWAEAGIIGRQLNVNWQRYGVLEEQNVIRWIGMREEGKLIGYASVCITYPLHHQQDKNALIDTIFLSKEARKGLQGAKIIDEIEIMVTAEGCDLLVFFERTHMMKKGVGLGDILKRKGFSQHETGWMKNLGA